MDDRNPAEDMPVVYREVLDVLALLEADGDRSTAYDLRLRAQRTYATRWDEGGLRALQKIVHEAQAKVAPRRRDVEAHVLARSA